MKERDMALMKLDHVAVACETLDAGRAYVEDALGVSLQPGGKHAHFGTHNMLLGLADGLYLEVIAVDPGAGHLPYPRWFDLDRFGGAPRLTNWICQTEDMDALRSALPEMGSPVALTRGALRWSMAVPPDGALPFYNRFPAIIAWGAGTTHPSDVLIASGCRLTELVISHPEAGDLEARIRPYMDAPIVVFEPGEPGMRATFDTPHGQRVLT